MIEFLCKVDRTTLRDLSLFDINRPQEIFGRGSGISIALIGARVSIHLAIAVADGFYLSHSKEGRSSGEEVNACNAKSF
jgi:hypothetical protein